MVIWGISFIVYSPLMHVDFVPGNTLPDMVITVNICIIVSRLKSKIVELKY